MLTSETITKIMPAFIKAQGEFKPAVKDAVNGQFAKAANGKDAKPSYVTLAQAIESVSGALRDNGIAIMQQTDITDHGGIILITRMIHSSGEWIASRYPVHPVKSDPQGEGSALTYARRYALMALVGIAPEDDDGNAATKAAERSAAKAASPTAGVWDAQSEDSQAFLLKIAAEIMTRVAADPDDAMDYMQSQQLDTDEKAALWTRLPSQVRTALTKAHNAKRKAA